MTENELKINGKSFSETISQIEEFMESDDVHGELFTVLRSARDFMENLNEEIQQYRAFGRVEEIQNMKDNGSFTGMELAQIAAMQMQLKDYQSIGTIDEFKALKEKNEPKKILYRKQSYGTPWLCPYCEADQIKVEFFSEDGSEPKEKYTFCWQCGTRIDWSE